MKRIISPVAGLLLLLGVLFGVAACATVDPSCEKEINDCLKRCEASGGEEAEIEHGSPEISTTYCEQRCQSCRESTTPAAPPPSSAPTYTGNAKP